MCDHKNSYCHGTGLKNIKHETDDTYTVTYYTIIMCTKCKKICWSLPIPYEVFCDLGKYNSLIVTNNYPTV